MQITRKAMHTILTVSSPTHREKKDSRTSAVKVLNFATGGTATDNCNKLVDILALRSLFPLFMKTPNTALVYLFLTLSPCPSSISLPYSHSLSISLTLYPLLLYPLLLPIHIPNPHPLPIYMHIFFTFTLYIYIYIPSLYISLSLFSSLSIEIR